MYCTYTVTCMALNIDYRPICKHFAKREQNSGSESQTFPQNSVYNYVENLQKQKKKKNLKKLK